jgi:hypothetical protein
LPKYNPKSHVLSEIEYGHISDQFENYSMERRGLGEEFSLKMFRDFADMHGYDLDVVLVCNPWVEEHLPKEVIDAIRKAEKKIKLNF